MIKKEAHEHRFKKEIEKVIAVRNAEGRTVAHDKLKLRECECGKTRAYDLERTKK